MSIGGPFDCVAPGTPADWAIERACSLLNDQLSRPNPPFRADNDRNDFAVAAFARYIEAHEQPPVDPLLIEARGIAVSASYGGDTGWATRWRGRVMDGDYDGEDRVKVALAALRRGIELAGER